MSHSRDFWCIICDVHSASENNIRPAFCCSNCSYTKVCSASCLYILHKLKHRTWCVAGDDATGALPLDAEVSKVPTFSITGDDQKEVDRLAGIVLDDKAGSAMGTCGVPLKWVRPVLGDTMKLAGLAWRRFAVCIPDVDHARFLIDLVRRTDPLKTFVNAVDVFDPKTRLFSGKDALIELREDSKAARLLAAFLEGVSCEKETGLIRNAFTLLMTHRARPLDHPFTCLHGGRAFCLLIIGGPENTDARVKIWVDVTYSKDPVQNSFRDPVPQPVPDRCCAVCDGVGAKVCATCKGRRYCSADCQRADWKEHRKVCVAEE